MPRPNINYIRFFNKNQFYFDQTIAIVNILYRLKTLLRNAIFIKDEIPKNFSYSIIAWGNR